MKLDGSVTIPAPRAQVWAFLTDPHAVGQCVPGLKSLEIVKPGERFRAVAAVGLGSVKVSFNADVIWEELIPPQKARMKGHGTAPGSAADATAEMLLAELPDGGTRLDWQADVTVSGTIASLASRLMPGVTQKLTASFFDCVREKVAAAPG